jgi:hypothetical protein
MGRLRARLARSNLDQAIQTQVAAAQRALDEAIELCALARRAGGAEARKSAKMLRPLGRSRALLDDLGRLGPLYDTSDPDLVSEDQRAREMRRVREEQRERRRAQKARRKPGEAAVSGGSS